MRSARNALAFSLLAIILGDLSIPITVTVSAATEAPLDKCQKCIADFAKVISPTCNRDVFATLVGADMNKKQHECVCPLSSDTNWLLACKVFKFCPPDIVENISKELQGRHEKSCLGATKLKTETAPSGNTTAPTTTAALDSSSTSTLPPNHSISGTGTSPTGVHPNGSGNPSPKLGAGSTLVAAAAMAALLL
ncbi:hypothetical protein EC957_002891 [Mortierella hygrophila]|uniref:Uncharacterized protein n=1 Tax=Mortierella hygrophila TaxID=979708 RepID=A0A9P6K0V4_9FUNG|nr:hypothetical protein EC957_002891 [Mortierella hygrophila]